ncbi:hypothetical protein [Methylibium petroleiphilum]|uniref:Transmembrane protein n=1 Tax=Methylibium petroleiphilum (strain ATCC BAA-1232 / LMG 22953 / PM1) TaxID=420662 RepID=A2SNC5_METPP|nr:hypothetical protein [Methylibium petroleiphilum]ABM97064.1 hypothetical protein Mpe_B0289 [Methylibium petroleiphilum PM1]
MDLSILAHARHALHLLVSAAHHLAGDLGRGDALVLAAVFVLSQLAARLGFAAYCLFALPGTLAHELAHYLVALLLRARPSLPSIIPEKTESGWRLGSVTFYAGLFRSVPIALAPMALAPLSLWWASSTLPGQPFGLPYAAYAWAAVTAFQASLPSSADWWIAAPALFLIGAVAALAILG